MSVFLCSQHMRNWETNFFNLFACDSSPQLNQCWLNIHISKILISILNRFSWFLDMKSISSLNNFSDDPMLYALLPIRCSTLCCQCLRWMSLSKDVQGNSAPSAHIISIDEVLGMQMQVARLRNAVNLLLPGDPIFPQLCSDRMLFHHINVRRGHQCSEFINAHYAF